MEERSATRNTADITVLLRSWSAGDTGALDQLTSVLYPELKRVARRCMVHERQGHTLQPTALVNEVYLRLINVHCIEWQDRAHFFALCAQIMRRILINYAVARGVKKRGGSARKVPLDGVAIPAKRVFDIVELNEALERLARLDPRKAQIVELHFFGGLGLEETAGIIGVSEKTVRRDWTLAKTWLAREMSQ